MSATHPADLPDDYSSLNRPLPPLRFDSAAALFAAALHRHPGFVAQAQVTATAAHTAARATLGLCDLADGVWTWLWRRAQAATSPVEALRCAVEAAAVMGALGTLADVHRRTLAGQFDRSTWHRLDGTQIAAVVEAAQGAAWASHPALAWYFDARKAEHRLQDARQREAAERAQATYRLARPAALLAELRACGVALALGPRPKGGLVVPRNSLPLTPRETAEVAEFRGELVALLEAEAHAAEMVAV